MRASALIPHQSSEGLEQAYRSATRSVERSRWQILWLKSKGKSIPELMDATGFSRSTITVLIRRDNQHGPAAVRDKRQDNGSKTALTREQQTHLSRALVNPPPMGGGWTSGKVQTYVLDTFGVTITSPCAWGYFKRLGFSVQRPRPRHHLAASPSEQETFKKK
ncbi:winged helix-turn-helix domain-containing protein [Deinococcus aquaedulcis]|uniref:winged helix-turn-helix domain-containing protein n=1 Tax=Deinococcus aquaedulcis TaxID=2840455 RepID=UPI001C82A786|nr:winged helix-turn-helix domain-containing protein [Deinococcus aquaedulcis]